MGNIWHTNLSWIDWAIMAAAVVALRMVSLSTRKYMRGVTDFLSANRMAGRYLLTIAGQMGNIGVVSFVALFEVLYSRGLSPSWWAAISIPTGTIIVLTGWVYYRFRETRALTMAQFLEMRYGRRLRIYAGILCWTSGVLNFGIFPAVAARFFIYYCGIPDYFHLPGIPWALPSIAPVMLIDLWLALTFVNMGGQVSVMITECIQGIFCCFAFLAVSFTILIKLHWSQMVVALQQASAPGASLINPFHTANVNDFNVYYYLIGFFSSFYAYMSWQGGQGFFSSARNPHEQKMGAIIGVWRDIPRGLTITLLALAALTVTKLPQFADTAHSVSAALSKIPNEHIQGQMQVPIAMAHFLPFVIKGLLATIFLFFSFTCHDTYMHSWGSIFVQDVYMPIKKKALSPEQHIKLLRTSITCVATFAFLFSLFVPPSDKILMFFAATGTIWSGGSGAVIIGGLYWRRGTTPAAYTALSIGLFGGIVTLVNMYLPGVMTAVVGRPLPWNPQQLYLGAMVLAAISYPTVAFFTSLGKRGFNLERMLHRGKYLTESDHLHAHDQVRPSRWAMVVGITKEFSKADKVLAIALVVWQAFWFLWFAGYMIARLFVPVGDNAFVFYHWVHVIAIPLALSVPSVIWFSIGGVMDIRALFRQLATAVRDTNDDGRVIHAEEPPAEEILAPTP